MAPRPRVPDELAHRPFRQSEALSLGVTAQMLGGSSWRRLFPRVWVHHEHRMSSADWIAASALAMPTRAQVSHLTRIQALGLDIGPGRPFHFTVAGDLHLDLEDIFLHRTEVMLPLDEVGVTPAAAYLQYCASARMIDAIKVGDWLLNHRHMTVLEVAELARRDAWRPGSRQGRRIVPHLDPGSQSLRESETRALLVFSGLPMPEVNKDVHDVFGRFLGRGDLVYLLWRLLVEYEGRQHEGDLVQWNIDIDRYRGFRDEGWRYVQVTKEKLDRPKAMVAEVYAQLVRGGYDGPAPRFGDRWRSLFEPINAKER